jgi:Spy/CpxP family protein refolding chaperone
LGVRKRFSPNFFKNNELTDAQINKINKERRRSMNATPRSRHYSLELLNKYVKQDQQVRAAFNEPKQHGIIRTQMKTGHCIRQSSEGVITIKIYNSNNRIKIRKQSHPSEALITTKLH